MKWYPKFGSLKISDEAIAKEKFLRLFQSNP